MYNLVCALSPENSIDGSNPKINLKGLQSIVIVDLDYLLDQTDNLIQLALEQRRKRDKRK